MPALSVEVNDAGLLAFAEGAVRPGPASPGLAHVAQGAGAGERVAMSTGAAALARAQLEPRAVCGDFWDRLDADPLGAPFPDGLSRADLALAQLRDLRQSAGTPAGEVIFAVPGFWPAGRLGLLLTVGRAAGLDVRGLVDSAVAAACFAPRRPRLLHLDLTRHRAVFTTIDGTAGSARERVGEAAGLGSAAFERAYTDHIVRRFVAETRFDPRHSGPSDQALHDRIPEWRRELRALPTCPAVLSAGAREHRVDLELGDFRRAAAGLHADLAARVRAAAEGLEPLLVLSARVTAEPGLGDHLRSETGLETFDLPYDAAVLSALRHRERIRRAGDALPFVTRLPDWADGPPSPGGER